MSFVVPSVVLSDERRREGPGVRACLRARGAGGEPVAHRILEARLGGRGGRRRGGGALHDVADERDGAARRARELTAGADLTVPPDDVVAEDDVRRGGDDA